MLDTCPIFRKVDANAPGGFVEINLSDKVEGDVEFTAPTEQEVAAKAAEDAATAAAAAAQQAAEDAAKATADAEAANADAEAKASAKLSK